MKFFNSRIFAAAALSIVLVAYLMGDTETALTLFLMFTLLSLRSTVRFALGSSFQNLDQFAPTPALGQPIKGPQPRVLACRILSTSVATGIQVGTPMKLVAAVGPEVVVDVCTSATADAVFGVIPLNTKKNKYVAGDVVDLFCDGSILMLESTAAINRGDNVAISNSSAVGGGPGVTTDVTSGHQIGGVALGQCAASQVLVAILIKASKLP